MHVTINGEAHTIDTGATVSELLTRLELAPVRVAVEINEDLVPRKTFDQAPLHEGDRIEIVTFVGGG